MELSGSTYPLQDVTPSRLIGIIGASTSQGAQGAVRLSFTQEAGLFSVEKEDSSSKLIVKWEVAIRLISLLHILLLQNRILRGELPELRVSPNRTRVFKLTGGRRTTAIECSWNDQTADVRCGRDPEGAPDEFELLLGEEAATDLVLALAAQIANNGTAMSREASMGG